MKQVSELKCMCLCQVWIWRIRCLAALRSAGEGSFSSSWVCPATTPSLLWGLLGEGASRSSKRNVHNSRYHTTFFLSALPSVFFTCCFAQIKQSFMTAYGVRSHILTNYVSMCYIGWDLVFFSRRFTRFITNFEFADFSQKLNDGLDHNK